MEEDVDVRSGSRAVEKRATAENAQNCFLNFLLRTVVASATDSHIDEIEKEVLHASRASEFSHSLGHSRPNWAMPRHVRFTPVSDRIADIAGGPVRADIVAKVFWGDDRNFSWTADAFRMRRCEGPAIVLHKMTTDLRIGATEYASRGLKNPRSRDFRHRSIFDFCNNICQKAKSHRPHCFGQNE